MKKVILALFALATALAISPVASAQNYDFSFSGGSYSGIGILDVGAGGVVTSLTGTFDGSTMSLLGVNGYAGNDNVFNSSGSPSYFDFSGLSFEANGIDYNLFYDGSTGTYLIDRVSNPVGYPNPSTQVTFSAQLPEGGAAFLYLLLAGATCFGVMFLSSRNRSANLTLA